VSARLNAPAPCAVVLRRLQTRGFRGLSEDQACRLGPWMRFTPALQALLFGLCTVTGSVPVLTGLAVMLAVGLLTARHPFDWLYGGVIRPLEHSPELPRSPFRRRMVFALGIVWCLATAWAFETGREGAGYLLGGLMTASTALLAFTHICVPSLVMARLFDGDRDRASGVREP
jgi:hypothetical protein